MPRLKQAVNESRVARFKAAVRQQMVMYGISSIGDLAERCGATAPTFYRKIKDPDRFTQGELRKLYNVLHFTDEQRLFLCK